MKEVNIPLTSLGIDKGRSVTSQQDDQGVVMLGLLTAGIAVPALILQLVPRPVAWTGLGIAATAELATIVLIWPPASPLLPLARFSALIWLVAVGVLLPKRRAARNRQEHAIPGGPA